MFCANTSSSHFNQVRKLQVSGLSQVLHFDSSPPFFAHAIKLIIAVHESEETLYHVQLSFREARRNIHLQGPHTRYCSLKPGRHVPSDHTMLMTIQARSDDTSEYTFGRTVVSAGQPFAFQLMTPKTTDPSASITGPPSSPSQKDLLVDSAQAIFLVTWLMSAHFSLQAAASRLDSVAV